MSDEDKRKSADKIIRELLLKFQDESAHADRDNRIHFARTGRRDIVVHLAVTILPDVDGHPVVGEKEREVGQWAFRLNSRQLPVAMKTARRAFWELMQYGFQGIAKIGALRE